MTWIIRDDDDEQGRSYLRSWEPCEDGTEAVWTAFQARAKRFASSDVARLTSMLNGGKPVRLGRKLVGNVTSYPATAAANFAAGTCKGEQEERARVIAFLRAYEYPTDPKTWARLIETGEHVKYAATQHKRADFSDGKEKA